MKSFGSREFRDLKYSEIAKIAKALADPKRMEILDLLVKSDKSGENLSKDINSQLVQKWLYCP